MKFQNSSYQQDKLNEQSFRVLNPEDMNSFWVNNASVYQ